MGGRVRSGKGVNGGRPGSRSTRILPAALLLGLALGTRPAAAQTSSTSLPSAPAPSGSSGSGGSSSGSSGSSSSGSTSGSNSGSNSGGSLGSNPGGSSGGGFPVQLPSQSSVENPYLGSVQTGPAVPRVLPLTLDDALQMGIQNNLGLVYAKEAQESNRAQRLETLNILLPNIDVQGSHAFHQFNLQAEGFRPGLISQLGSLMGGAGGAGGGTTMAFPTIVKVDVTQGIVNLSQNLFNLAAFDLLSALNHSLKAAAESSTDARGQVVENVGIAYLRVIAAQSQVQFDQSLLKTDAAVLYTSEQEHQAGVVANLDELRARVQYGAQQQAVIADSNTLQKAKIALNRSIGLAPDQEIAVVETTPFPALELMSPDAAETEALGARQDFQSSLEQLLAAQKERKAATHERLPTLLFNGDYAITGVPGLVYHGTFLAAGTLQIPVFQEGRFRSDRDLAEYQLANARAQVGNLREEIRQQVRDSLIDLQAYTKNLAVAKSNVALGQTALNQAIERFQAGIEQNLPAIEAASTLAQAQVQAVNATFEYNQAKLVFAYNLGMIGVDYHPEWQGGRPAGVLSDRAARGQ